MTATPHFVLVHGAYHRAWHLHLLQEQLQQLGFTVSTLDLPAAGEPSTKYETGGLKADTEAVKVAIEDAATTSNKLVIVFHSYSGVCGSEAVAELSEDTKNKIQHLIYLAALVLPAGHALTTHSKGQLAPWGTAFQDGKFAYVPDPVSCFYHDVEPQRAADAASKVVPHATSCFHEETKHAGWRLFPRTYVFCNEDRAVPPFVQHAFFDNMPEEDRAGWQFEEMDASHSPFLSKPKETAELIVKIVGQNK